MNIRVLALGMMALAVTAPAALAFNGLLTPQENLCINPSRADQQSGLNCNMMQRFDNLGITRRQAMRHQHHHMTNDWVAPRDTVNY
jgi:hypothetical protein